MRETFPWELLGELWEEVTYLNFGVLYQMLSHGFYQNFKEKPRIQKKKKKKKESSKENNKSEDETFTLLVRSLTRNKCDLKTQLNLLTNDRTRGARQICTCFHVSSSKQRCPTGKLGTYTYHGTASHGRPGSHTRPFLSADSHLRALASTVSNSVSATGLNMTVKLWM